jgi:hypothetical protein
MVDDFKEDVHCKRAKIDLMSLGKPEDGCHGRRSARCGRRADEGAEEGFALGLSGLAEFARAW